MGRFAPSFFYDNTPFLKILATPLIMTSLLRGVVSLIKISALCAIANFGPSSTKPWLRYCKHNINVENTLIAIFLTASTDMYGRRQWRLKNNVLLRYS